MRRMDRLRENKLGMLCGGRIVKVFRVVDRMPALKTYFIRQAAGLTGATPRLLKGEAL